MMKKQPLIVFSLITSMILAGCEAITRPPFLETITIPPTHTKLPQTSGTKSDRTTSTSLPVKTPLATSTSTITLAPSEILTVFDTSTGTPMPSETPSFQQFIPKQGLGTVWIMYEDNRNKALRIDLEKGGSETIALPYCYEMLPQKNIFDCKDRDTSERFIYNPDTGEKTHLGIKNIWWWDWSPNGKYFLYEEDLPPEVERPVYRYDFSIRASQPIFSVKGTFLDRIWEISPRISHDGKYIIVPESGSLKRLVLGSDKTQSLTPPEIFANIFIFWSPTDPLLLFGAIDPLIDVIPPIATYFYLFDARDGSIRKLMTASGGTFYIGLLSHSWNPWSPDGKHVMTVINPRDYDDTSRPVLYLATVENGEQTRVSISDPGYSIIEPTWSPDGKYLFYFAETRGKIKGDSYFALYNIEENVETRLSMNIDENDIVRQIFWRK